MFQKISGILPSNARITSVDVQSERPRRPGGPDLGLPVAERKRPMGGFTPDTGITANSSPVSNVGAATLRTQMEKGFFDANRTDIPDTQQMEIEEGRLDIYA